MPWSGASGSQTYSRTDGTRTGATVWQQAKAASVKIVADGHDTHDQDIATALNAVLKKDGGNTATADLPMGGYKHTNVDNATARNQYAAVGQVQDGSLTWCGTATGTKNAIVLSPSVAIPALVEGMRLAFKAGAASSDDAVTVTVSANDPVAVELDDAALSASQTIVAGKQYELVFDGTAFQITRKSTAHFTGSATFTGAVALASTISPAQITADQNNYSPTGLAAASCLRINADAARTLTGLAAGADGELKVVHNVGGNPITLADENASSTAANRFALAADAVLFADQSLTLRYDGTSSRWRRIDGSLPPASDAQMAAGTSNGVAVTPANVTKHPLVPKAWLIGAFSGATPAIADDEGVSSLSSPSTGQLTVTWDGAFSDVNYAAGGNGGLNGTYTFMSLVSRLAGSYTFIFVDAGNNSIYPALFTVWAMGRK